MVLGVCFIVDRRNFIRIIRKCISFCLKSVGGEKGWAKRTGRWGKIRAGWRERLREKHWIEGERQRWGKTGWGEGLGEKRTGRERLRKALDRGVKTTMGERLGGEKDWERKGRGEKD